MGRGGCASRPTIGLKPTPFSIRSYVATAFSRNLASEVQRLGQGDDAGPEMLQFTEGDLSRYCRHVHSWQRRRYNSTVTLDHLNIFNVLYLILLVAVAIVTRASSRRTSGAMPGTFAAAAAGIAIIAICEQSVGGTLPCTGSRTT